MSPETKKYDAIVVMPYSSNLRTDGTDVRLSYWSAQSVHAAFHLWESSLAPKLIIPGESVFGQRAPSTTDLMERYLSSKGVAQDSIIARSGLNNTVMQLDEVKRLQEQTGMKLLFLCCNWHLERVRQTMASMNIDGAIAEVEEVLSENHRQTDHDRLLNVPTTIKMRNKDKRLRTNPLTRQLIFQKIAVKLFGARIVDLRDDTYAIFKRRAAQRVLRRIYKVTP